MFPWSRSEPPSPQAEAASKRARTGSAASLTTTAAIATANSYAALQDREPEPREDLTLEASQHAPQQPAPVDASATSSSAPQRTYAHTVKGDPQPSRRNKRKGGTAPSGMLEKERGAAWFRHPLIESFLRPAPRNGHTNVLWLDLQSLRPATDQVAPADALAAAFEVIGSDAVGVVTAGGMRSIGIVFPSQELRDKYDGKHLKNGLVLYQALSQSRHQPIRRLTLQNVPVDDKPRVLEALKKIFATHGELLEVVPLLIKGTPWISDTFHVTVAMSSLEEVPETIDLLGFTVLVHIPGERRVCPHCKSVEHTDENCRTARRQRERQQHQQSPPTPQHPTRRPPRPSPAASWEDQDDSAIAAAVAGHVEEVTGRTHDIDSDPNPYLGLSPTEVARRKDQWDGKNSDDAHAQEADTDSDESMADASDDDDASADTATSNSAASKLSSRQSKRVTRSQGV
jgi:hypothetical protein